MQQADRYDKYDRKGPKIYVGEYAVTQGCGQGNLRGAIGEAAFMTGMERNSDIVVMASLRAAVRQRQPQAVEPRPDQLRQLARLRPAVVLRAEDVRARTAATSCCPSR